MMKQAYPTQYLTIQQVSKKLNIPKPTLRFWERDLAGIIVPSRTKGGQRRYDQKTISIIEEIKRMRDEGYSLAQIRYRFHGRSQNGKAAEYARPKEIEIFADRVAEIVRSEVYRLFEKKGTIPVGWFKWEEDV